MVSLILEFNRDWTNIYNSAQLNANMSLMQVFKKRKCLLSNINLSVSV